VISSFAPSFRNFRDDIERKLHHEGKVDRNEFGQTVFRGYQEALEQMFRAYLDEKAYAPLVSEYRKWNWEWNYGDDLLLLTSRLHQSEHWSLLKELWSAVVAKRRTNYNKTRKAQKDFPDRIPQESVAKTQELLLDSLRRLHQFAIELGHEAEMGEYVEMIDRVERFGKA
jgi:hypothetical protein